MKFSFIIATLYDKRRELDECLNSIERAYENKKDADLEILVVIQGPEENKQKFKIRYPELFTFFNIREPGLSKARNYGIRKSKGGLLIFLDDDARIKDDFLEVLDAIVSEKSAGAFCGRILEQETGRCYAVYFEDNKERFLRRADYGYFLGSSHILKRSTIEKIGLYDEKLGAGGRYPGAEESDIFFRMKNRGMRILYAPTLVLFHPIPDRTTASKIFYYSYASGAMLAKQIVHDRLRLFFYMSVITKIMIKSLARTVQSAVIFKSIESKNARFHYVSVLTGFPKGIFDYFRETIRSRMRKSDEDRNKCKVS